MYESIVDQNVFGGANGTSTLSVIDVNDTKVTELANALNQQILKEFGPSAKKTVVIEINRQNFLDAILTALICVRAALLDDRIDKVLVFTTDTLDSNIIRLLFTACGDDCGKLVFREVPIDENVVEVAKITGHSDFEKIRRDMSRSAAYYISNVLRGVVMTTLNATQLRHGIYSKTSDRVGDWNIISDFEYTDVCRIMQSFGAIGIPLDIESILAGYVKKYSDLSDACPTHKQQFPLNITSDKIPLKTGETPDISVRSYASPFPLHPELADMLEELRRTESYDLPKWIDTRTRQLRDYIMEHNLQDKALIVLVSGGVDSAVVMALCDFTKKLFSLDLSHLKIIPVMVPISSTQSVQNRAADNCDHFGISYHTANLTEVHDAMCKIVSKSIGFERNQYSDGCFRSSLRAPVAYAYARMYGGIVMGTGNMSEDGKLGFFSKSGDGLVDIQIIADLYKWEVIQVGAILGVIQTILEAEPTADLGLVNNTDETELGVSYDSVELVMRLERKYTNDELEMFLSTLSPESKEAYCNASARINRVHCMNKHKFRMPYYICR
jgi:NAD+ synthase (glutamine-hydrolysing)